MEKILFQKIPVMLPDMPDPTELKENGILIDTVPNTGHFLMFENLDGFVEVLTKFINKGKK